MACPCFVALLLVIDHVSFLVQIHALPIPLYARVGSRTGLDTGYPSIRMIHQIDRGMSGIIAPYPAKYQRSRFAVHPYPRFGSAIGIWAFKDL